MTLCNLTFKDKQTHMMYIAVCRAVKNKAKLQSVLAEELKNLALLKKYIVMACAILGIAFTGN